MPNKMITPPTMLNIPGTSLNKIVANIDEPIGSPRNETEMTAALTYFMQKVKRK
jgi:hypothetical protein